MDNHFNIEELYHAQRERAKDIDSSRKVRDCIRWVENAEFPKTQYDIICSGSFMLREVYYTLQKACASHKGAYLYGKPGTGKTISSIAHVIACIQQEFLSGPIQFVNVPEFFIDLRNNLSNRIDGQGYELIKKQELSTSPVVIFDDIGTENSSQWVLMLLYSIIDARYNNCLYTLFTSNYPIEELAARYGEIGQKIVSRISGMCSVIKVNDIDWRAQ